MYKITMYNKSQQNMTRSLLYKQNISEIMMKCHKRNTKYNLKITMKSINKYSKII